MSNTVARFLENIISAVTLPMSNRQRNRVVARLINRLEKNSLVQVNTSRGNLNLYALKSGITASAIDRFFVDEPETLSWIDSFSPGSTFWDIGANIGLYSLYAGLRKDISVYAFEPSGLNFELLVQHIITNKMDQSIKALCIALGDYTHLGNLHMKKFEYGHASNALDMPTTQMNTFDAQYSQSIIAFSIDDFIAHFGLREPDHIKLDVDGIEAKIIAGARKTLPKVNSLLVEVEGYNENNFEDLIQGPLLSAGFTEDESIRTMGHRRNRLFTKT